MEFGLIVQQESVRENFDEHILLWSKSILKYCKETQTKSTSIKKLICETSTDDVDMERK